MKKILFVLVVCSLALTGCKKKGCTDPAALNYDSKAKQEDGSCEFPPPEAVLTTTSASNVTTVAATLGGNITSSGSSSVTQRGVCYGTSSSPTTANSTTNDGSGTGSFSSSLTGLTGNTTYYVRAYATNSEVTAYGNEVSFTTAGNLAALTTASPSNVTYTSASLGGTITFSGISSVTQRGVCYGTSTNPTTSNSTTNNGSGIGSFSSSLTGLTPSTTYYVRAYATNSAGTAYGNEVSFSAGPANLATLTTASASNITASSAVSGGNITNNGGGSVTQRGLCYGTSSSPTTTNSTTNNGSGTGSFSSNLTGLTAGTTYYVRAYATNSAGTAYGNEVNFTTPVNLATLTTASASNVTTVSASLGGNITNNGGGSVTQRGVCYGTSSSPTTANNTTNDGSGTGSFSSNLTGLTAGTTYYVRAYATNSAGTAYGNEVSFTGGSPVYCNGTPTTIVDVTNPTTGAIWMDRNLGATQAATSSTDVDAYGDLYQWGRRSDGHQCRTSATNSALSSTDQPAHGDFILAPNSPYDWRSPQNTNLWQGVNGTNNPCPSGYRIPTSAELGAEHNTWTSDNGAGAYASPLKLPMAGRRSSSGGSLGSVGLGGSYWSSSVSGASSLFLFFYSISAYNSLYDRAYSCSVRCIKN